MGFELSRPVSEAHGAEVKPDAELRQKTDDPIALDGREPFRARV
jgi:hypothetical protein